MQDIDFVSPLGRLVQKVRHEGELGDDAVAEAAFGDILQVTAQIPRDPTGLFFNALHMRLNRLAWA